METRDALKHGDEKMPIYHVIRDWDGGDLKSFARRVDDGEMGTLDEALEHLAEKWDITGRAADEYLAGDGQEVHCHATLAEAIDYRDEWCPGGVILAIDDSELEVGVGEEYPHPVVAGVVPAELISVVEIEAA